MYGFQSRSLDLVTPLGYLVEGSGTGQLYQFNQLITTTTDTPSLCVRLYCCRMDTRRPEPEVVQSMRRRILEIDLQVAEMQREEYRKLLLSLVGEGAADAATSESIRNSVPQRPQPRADVSGLTQISSIETS